MKNITCPQDKQTLYPPEKTSAFLRGVIKESALASNNIRGENFDLDKAKQCSAQGIAALQTKEGLQTTLAAQMLSIHCLQQQSMIYANAITDMESKQYYSNTALKLASCFVQQANMLAKLQGMIGQQLLVGRVDVHDGGQAVVGNIHGSN